MRENLRIYICLETKNHLYFYFPMHIRPLRNKQISPPQNRLDSCEERFISCSFSSIFIPFVLCMLFGSVFFFLHISFSEFGRNRYANYKRLSGCVCECPTEKKLYHKVEAMNISLMFNAMYDSIAHIQTLLIFS